LQIAVIERYCFVIVAVTGMILTYVPSLQAKSKTKAPTKSSTAAADLGTSGTRPAAGHSASEFVGGVVNGKGHLYKLIAPKGWQMDTKSGLVRGIPVIFTPPNLAGPDYPAVLYSQIMQRNGRGLDELVRGLVNMMRPGAELPDDFVQPAISLSAKRQVLVRKLPPSADGSRELVAFIEEKDWLVLVILAADTEADAASVRPAFESLVRSYNFVVDKVKMEE